MRDERDIHPVKAQKRSSHEDQTALFGDPRACKKYKDSRQTIRRKEEKSQTEEKETDTSNKQKNNNICNGEGRWRKRWNKKTSITV